jgi:hypothetical protein
MSSMLAFADPPSRVARISFSAGAVSLRPAAVDEWSTASLNYPLTTGDHLWTDTRARTELQLDTVVLRVAPSTELSVLNLDDHVAQLRVTQGTVSVRVSAVDAGDTMEIDTPAGAVSLLEPGLYRLDVNDAGDATVITVRQGQADMANGTTDVMVKKSQSVTVSLDSSQPDVQPAIRLDEFVYVQRINAAHATNVASVSVTKRTYVNRSVPGAVTAVARETFVRSQPVEHATVAVTREQIQSAKVIGATEIAHERVSVTGTAVARVQPPPAAVSRAVMVKTAPPAPTPLVRGVVPARGPAAAHVAPAAAAPPPPPARAAAPSPAKPARPAAKPAPPPANAALNQRFAQERADIQARHAQERADLQARHRQARQQARDPHQRAELQQRQQQEMKALTEKQRQERDALIKRQQAERGGKG